VTGGAVLAADGGKSGLRIVVRDGAETFYGRAAGTFAVGREVLAGVLDSLRSAIQDSGFAGSVAAVCAGLTSVPLDRRAYTELRDGIVNVCGAPSVAVLEDCVTAHRGALGRPGTVLAVGTGVVAMAIGKTGAAARRDGWGPLLGDRGSGFDIGRRGLRAAWSATDGVAEPTALSARMVQFLGGEHLADVQRFYARADVVPRVSEFAVEVFAAAHSGDAVATGIIRRSAADLAATAASAAFTLSPPACDVSYSGRLFDAGAVMVDPLTAELANRGLTLVGPRGSALDGALAIATEIADRRDHGIYHRIAEGPQTKGNPQ